MKKVKLNNRNFELYISRDEIQNKISQISNKLNKEYRDKNPVFIVVLTGSIFFATDIIKSFKYDCNVQLVNAKSYGNDMESSGKVQINNLNLDIKDREIVIIEDIVDTGITLNSILNIIKKLEPKSIATVSLLSKPSRRIVKVEVEYIGFEIEDKFVIGYGMDYAELGRNLNDIYILKE